MHLISFFWGCKQNTDMLSTQGVFRQEAVAATILNVNMTAGRERRLVLMKLHRCLSTIVLLLQFGCHHHIILLTLCF